MSTPYSTSCASLLGEITINAPGKKGPGASQSCSLCLGGLGFLATNYDRHRKVVIDVMPCLCLSLFYWWGDAEPSFCEYDPS